MAKIKLNAKKCKGCLLCVKFCPQKVFEKGTVLNAKGFHPVVLAKDYKCIACGQCTLMCPECGIEIR